MQKGSVGGGEIDNMERKDKEKVKKHTYTLRNKQKETEGGKWSEVIMVKRSSLQ